MLKTVKIRTHSLAHHKTRGQSMAELAVSFVVILFIVLGLIDLGRVYFTYVALEDAVGEGAIYLSIDPSCQLSTDGVACLNGNNGCDRVKDSGGGNLVNWSAVVCGKDLSVLDLSLNPGGGIYINAPVPEVGNDVEVQIRYPFTLITPFVQSFLNMSGVTRLELTSQATQTIITE